VLGSSCPPHLAPPRTAPRDRGASLVVIAPSELEAGDPHWHGASAKQAAAALDPDGVVYVLAPPRPRRRLRRALRKVGIERVEGFLHAPDVARSRFIVPLRRRTLRYAFAQLVPTSARYRLLASLVAALPPTRALELLAGPVGFAAQRPMAPDLFGWLGDDGASRVAIVALGVEDPERVTVHAFPRSARSPSFVAKLGGGPDRDAALAAGQAHCAGAEDAGIAVPGPLPPIGDGQPIWRETALTGTNAALLLRRRPRRLPEIVPPLVRWLDEWQRRTATETVLGPTLLDEWIREPLAALQGSLHAGGDYEGRLEGLCRSAEGRVPLVTMHGDLTMANVIVGRRGPNGRTRIGVVDWETARPRALPLLDLFYMLADAGAAIGGYEDRPAAARDCFSGVGRSARSTSAARLQLARTLRLTDDVTALCFHACWLHHAANEARTQADGKPRPFLEIVDWVARSPKLLPGLAIP
jgi:hypothetical protein